MSSQEQTRMLYILHKNGVSRKNITIIMKDLRKTGIFDEKEEQSNLDNWDFLEEQADWLFSNASNSEKINALKNIRKKQEELERTRESQYSLEQEKRIQAKIQELIQKGVIEPDALPPQSKGKKLTRYGRSPLHEAIAIKDIRLVKRFIKSGKYLDKVDNNGHTAMEMAFYEDYKEALILFERYDKKK